METLRVSPEWKTSPPGGEHNRTKVPPDSLEEKNVEGGGTVELTLDVSHSEMKHDTVPELQSGSPEYMQDRLEIWQSMLKQKNDAGKALEEGIIGPTRDVTFTNKQGETLKATEELYFDGQSFVLRVYAEGKKQAFVRYQNFGDALKMGKTEVSEALRGYGINSLLFQDMSALHPDATRVYTKLDGVNFDVYLDQVKTGIDPVTAANNTPAGRVRVKAGWSVDTSQSNLPKWKPDEGIGGIRLVYTREKT